MPKENDQYMNRLALENPPYKWISHIGAMPKENNQDMNRVCTRAKKSTIQVMMNYHLTQRMPMQNMYSHMIQEESPTEGH